MEKTQLYLSIIIPAYNEKKRIGKTLLDGIDDEIELNEETTSINKKNMTRREFFLLFSPTRI